jgi:hypothetical protein
MIYIIILIINILPSDADAKYLPLGENLTQLTGLLCPLNKERINFTD